MRRSWIVIVALALFSACLAIAASQSATADILGGSGGSVGTVPVEMPELVDARAKFKAGDATGALKLAQAAAKKNQDLPPGNVWLAQQHAEAKNAGGVRNALEAAIVEAPDDPEAYLFMGNVAIQERRVFEARTDYEKAFSLLGKVPSTKRRDVLNPMILNGLAMVAEAHDDWAGAQRQLEAWLVLDPKNIAPLQRLAHCLFEQKDVEGALATLRKAFKIEPKMLVPEAIVATYYMATDDKKASRDKAWEWLNTALKAYPQDLKTRLLAAQWLWKIDKLPDAAVQADYALKLPGKTRDETIEAQMVRGQIAWFQKDYPTAENCFQTAHVSAPGNFGASNNLALVLVEQKDAAKKELALQYAAANVRASNQTQAAATACSTYGWVQFRRKEYDDADRFLRMAMNNGVNPDTAYYWACLQQARGHDADAVKFLEFVSQFKGPFAYRAEADAMLKELKKE
jgi:tetratricopeptide (TPR) repeat protein